MKNKQLNLEHQKNFTLAPTAPFHFDSTFHKPDHFTSGDNVWDTGIKWQTMRWRNKCLGLKFIANGSINKPTIKLEVYSGKSLSGQELNDLKSELTYRYNLSLDLSEFYKSQSKDGVLGPIIEKWRGMRPGHPSSLYEYLIIGVVLQNATVRRSQQMFQALLENYGTRVDFDGKKLLCFWEPGTLQEVTEEDLRATKVGYRAKTIKKIDDCFKGGFINEASLRGKSREEQMEALLALYGVGPATVWYLLFDVFHQWDFFNHVSPWEQKIYSRLFFDKGLVPVETLLKHFKKYGKYKQLAVHYIWEDLWWKRKHEHIPWLEKEIRL